METKIQKWGNSLGVRIPQAVAKGARLKVGSAVEITAEDEAVVIRPTVSVRYTLKELLRGVTAKNLHREVDAGVPVGKEAL
jgi:antitoxin MazE